MGYRYINNIITPENLNRFLELVDLAAGAGKDTNNVFDLSDRLNISRPMERCIDAIKLEPASIALVEERYVGEPYELDTLLQLPPGSLGWTYAKVLSALNYNPQFYRTPDSFNSDAEYISYRVYRTHDLHHILTGFNLDGLGELGVISVTAAQIGFPAFVFLDFLSLLTNFFSSEQLYREDLEPTQKGKTLKYTFELISKGIDIGQAAKPLFPVKWEEGFDRPLEEWRQSLNIVPVTEGIFSWYSNPKLAAAVAY
jgi:ubiquinone biosynthesis protein Coq4